MTPLKKMKCSLKKITPLKIEKNEEVQFNGVRSSTQNQTAFLKNFDDNQPACQICDRIIYGLGIG